jgi:carbon storage regulator CsrA
MLVLSRKKNETIIIDGRIKVEILKIKGNTIRLGITAPKEMKVLRGELSPFEIEIESDHQSDRTESKRSDDLLTVAEEKLDYVQNSGGYPVSANEAAALPNPFAVIAS